MKTLVKSRTILGLMLALVYFSVMGSYVTAFADSPEFSTAVFYVDWYDVGKAALEGLEGVRRVENGFKNFKEINTVYYDPRLIMIEDMEEALKEAGTYRETAN